jgi:hypothetical protein
MCGILASISWCRMRRYRLFPATGVALLGTALAISAGQAAPFPTRSGQLGPELQITLAGEREAAAVAGALVGGAVGVLLGSTLPRPAPPTVIVEEPVERVVVERRPVRRIVEVEEEVPPPSIEECVTRRTKVYDQHFDETIVRKERRCR